MNERELQAALGRMAEASPPPEDARDAAERRRHVVPRVEAALRGVAEQRVRSRRRSRVLGGLAVAASIVLALGIGWRVRVAQTTSAPVAAVPQALVPAHVAQSSGTVLLVHAGATSIVPPSAQDAPVASGDELVTTPEARARVALVSGAVVEEAPSTRLAFAIPAQALHDERLSLSAGQATVHVPTLGAGESFEIVTPDAEVIGRGTGFVVSVQGDGSPRTHVSVTEGAVLVRSGGREVHVGAGEQWPAPAVSTPATASLPSPASAPSTAAGSASTPSLRAPSTLADQNALLQSALDARRAGDDGRAVSKLDELLTKYPASPLGQEAHVERFRALERMGKHAAAVSEARLYLSAYPAGFARDEARAIVLR
jgi:hypothetical protein